MTSIETGPTWSERLNPRNWTLAWKLVIVGLVPALLALTLGVLRISDLTASAGAYSTTQRFITVQSATATLIGDLQAERNQAVIYAAGRRDQQTSAAVTAAAAAVDSSHRALSEQLADRTGLSTAIVDGDRRVEQGLAGLGALRSGVLRGALPADQVLSGYSAALAPLLGFNTVVVVEQLDAVNRSGDGRAAYSLALYGLTGAREQISLQQAAMSSAIATGTLSDPLRSIVVTAGTQLNGGLQEVGNNPDPDLRQRLGGLAADPAFQTRTQLLNQLLTPGPLAPIDLATWNDANVRLLAAVTSLAAGVRDTQTALVTTQEAAAQNLAGINSVLLMLGLLLAATIAILVSRSLIRSLRVLRTAALDVAERRLPQAVESMRAGESPDVTVDPVPLNSRDEVGQVARAFDAVHGQAVRLAADQAALQSNVSAMFVNLSRRSQALVERQLQLIEQLESNEQDADQLSNLFQLDHLATRMRRNSENLLVLAGTDLAKRNIAPVPMVDVLRAAVSEVEQYQRIVVQAPPTASIVGRAGSDLVHLLAELLDNATNFSPPDSQVVMSTTRTSDGSIIVEIADRGVGMIDHELSDANQRLGGPSSVDVSASRRMGLFVVGRLGARHGIGVRLSTSAAGGPGAGLTASVTVPAYLIPASEPAGSGRPIGIPQPAGVPAQGGRVGDVPSQRANGAGRPGSLSALVAGTDGPANPAGVFEGTDSPLFGSGGANGVGHDSGVTPLPSRRPGSSLRPEGPPPPELPAPGSSDGADDDAVAAKRADDQRRAREVAEQARRDQEAAAERERVAAAAEQRPDDDTGPDAEADAHGTNGARSNGVHPRAFMAPAPFARRPVAGAQHDESDDDQDSPSADDERTVSDDERTSTDGQRTDLQQRGDRSGPLAPPVSRPPVVSPPTTPMPVVRPGDTAQTPQPAPSPQQAPQPAASPQPAVAEAPRPAPAPQAPPAPQPVAQAPTGFPARRPDELFAPSVPNIAEPGRVAAETQAGFERGETTPIFEEIASAWFRSNRPVPVIWETEDGDAQPEAQVQARPAPAPAPAPAPMAPPAPAAPSAPPLAPRPEARPPSAAEPRMPQRPPAPAPRPAPRPAPAPVEAAWVDPAPEPRPAAEPIPDRSGAHIAGAAAFAGAADEGWRAASGIESDRPDELTSAGLPKRRPRARLVPGSAGSAVLSPPVTASRSAETIRGRLASYQQGVRQGRETMARGEAGSANDTDDTATSTNHEEQA